MELYKIYLDKNNSVETALNSVVSNIKLLKDDSGNIVWPELGISTIENMEAGKVIY